MKTAPLRNRLLVLAVPLITLCVTPALASTDLLCQSSGARFELPNACLKSCKYSAVKFGCFFSPQCQGMKAKAEESQRSLVRIYNAAIFGIGRLPLVSPYVAQPEYYWEDSLVAAVINHFYSPFKATDVQIMIEKPPHVSWCEVDRNVAAGQHPKLWMDPEVLLQSPPFLVSCIGHEMVHMLQIQRKYTSFRGINDAITAFRELEAFTWETGNHDFHWEIGPSPVFNCVTTNESRELELDLRCAQWQVRKEIGDLNEPPQRYLGVLDKWLKEDPWTSSQWLPQNPNWRTYRAGPRPHECESQ
jgi:hypothetical protein